MPDHGLQLPWTRPDWLDQASAWIHAGLERQGISVGGQIEQPHLRPWSTVLRVPVPDGVVYFKATTPALAHEPALTQALWRWRPDCMPEVLAVDLERGWILMRDAGAMLRSHIHSAQDIRHWRRLLPLYAEVQIEMAGRLDELLALGALDRRLATLPAQFDRLLEDTEALRLDLPDGLTSEEYQRLRQLAPRFTAMCQELAAYGIPETLHHDDFHDGNVFVRDGRYIFSDWGESCVAHPFFTLTVALRSIAWRFELAENASELARLRDVYLEPWLRYESRENLLAAATLAQRLGMVCRALTWHHVVSPLPQPFKAEHAGAVPGWLQEFLNTQSSF